MIVHGAGDYLLPVDDSVDAYRNLCDRGSPTRLRIYTDEDHLTVPRASESYVVRWMHDRLAGERISGCSSRRVA
jgi:dipeptidyl aminopeptidase/acylaminoacyl peptidase